MYKLIVLLEALYRIFIMKSEYGKLVEDDDNAIMKWEGYLKKIVIESFAISFKLKYIQYSININIYS